jgi:hypothetical protein
MDIPAEKLLPGEISTTWDNSPNNKPDAVVIKDICKGVVSRWLIKHLADHFKELPWFISTKGTEFDHESYKITTPDWLKLLKDVDVRLFLLPQVPAQRVVADGICSAWFTRSGEPTQNALAIIDSIGTSFNHALIVALPDQSTALIRNKPRSRRGDLGAVWQESTRLPYSEGTPMASVLFGALVGNLLCAPDITVTDLLHSSIEFTQRWRAHEVQRVIEPEKWLANETPSLKPGADKDSSRKDLRSFKWDEAREQWAEAFRDDTYGIVDRSSSPRIELWRAMTEVEDYICLVETKRRALQAIVRELSMFKSEGARRQRSVMLVAPPGSGKSYLIGKLAAKLRLHFLEFNITQMLSRRDILDCFDVIATTQFQHQGESVLVFVDEVDAPLDGNEVYDAFLAALERGIYIRGGHLFGLKPCAWVFAGTHDPAPDAVPPDRLSPKASDFVSRLTLKPQRFAVKKEEEKFARLEKVYLGVSQLRSEFPDVRRVSEKVLRSFHMVRPDLSVRDLTYFVKSFADIQYGEVLSKHVPNDYIKKLGIDKGTWEGSSEGPTVLIV